MSRRKELNVLKFIVQSRSLFSLLNTIGERRYYDENPIQKNKFSPKKSRLKIRSKNHKLEKKRIFFLSRKK